MCLPFLHYEVVILQGMLDALLLTSLFIDGMFTQNDVNSCVRHVVVFTSFLLFISKCVIVYHFFLSSHQTYIYKTLFSSIHFTFSFTLHQKWK